MKALSVKQPWASLIERGDKTIETRTRQTNYRGDILICSSGTIDKINMKFFKPLMSNEFNFPLGEAICIVELYDIRIMTDEDEEKALCPVYPGAYAWMLRNIRPIEPFPVKGQLRLFEVDYEQ